MLVRTKRTTVWPSLFYTFILNERRSKAKQIFKKLLIEKVDFYEYNT
jgi:hypothetical protein